MKKHTYLEVIDDYLKSTWKITEYTDNRDNLSYRPIKIIEETVINNNVIVTYITDKCENNGCGVTLSASSLIDTSNITDMSYMFCNCDILDALHEIVEYINSNPNEFVE